MQNIKTTYIHGLDGHPKPEKMEIMKQAGLDVSALHLNYRENKNVYAELKKLIKTNNTKLLIGSSFGGMLSYYLAEELGIPCLLFNPAVAYQSVKVEIPEIKNKICPLRIVVLGEKDDTINPVENAKLFKQKERTSLSQKIITCSWLGHQIDLQTFDEMVFFALRNYSIWQLKNI